LLYNRWGATTGKVLSSSLGLLEGWRAKLYKILYWPSSLFSANDPPAITDESSKVQILIIIGIVCIIGTTIMCYIIWGWTVAIIVGVVNIILLWICGRNSELLVGFIVLNILFVVGAILYLWIFT